MVFQLKPHDGMKEGSGDRARTLGCLLGSGWKNPSGIYWGEGNGGEDKTKGFPPSRKGPEIEETQGAPVSSGASNQSNPVAFAVWPHRSFSKLLQDQRNKINVRHGKRNCKPRNPTTARRDRSNQKKPGEKWIRNSEVILHFKYRRFSKRKSPGRPFFFQFFLSVLLLSVSFSVQVLPSWDFHFSASYLGQNPNNPVQKKKSNPESRTPSPAQSKLSLMLTNYPVIVFIGCWHARKCSS